MAVTFKRFNNGLPRKAGLTKYLVVESSEDAFKPVTTVTAKNPANGFTWTGKYVSHDGKEALYTMTLNGNDDHPTLLKTEGQKYTEVTVTITIDNVDYPGKTVPLYDD